jgi:hypothetical protein
VGANDSGGEQRGKRLRATARFLSVYGRLPNEFSPETAMGLYANIPAIEAAQSMTTAKAIAMAFGDAKSQSDCVYQMTGNARLAKRMHIDSIKAKNQHG